jgi:hypothetical protein
VPSLPMFMFAAVLLGSPPSAKVPDPMEPFLSFLGVTLEETTLEQAQAKLGGPKAVHNGGDAAASMCAQCYTGSDGTTLVLVSNKEMGGCSITNEYWVLQSESLADYSGDERRVVAKDNRPVCSHLKGLSRSSLVGGRLKLGMTKAQVLKLMGKPSKSSGSRVSYSSAVPAKMTNEEKVRLKGQGEFTTLRSVTVDFADGRAVDISAFQATSN